MSTNTQYNMIRQITVLLSLQISSHFSQAETYGDSTVHAGKVYNFSYFLIIQGFPQKMINCHEVCKEKFHIQGINFHIWNILLANLWQWIILCETPAVYSCLRGIVKVPRKIVLLVSAFSSNKENITGECLILFWKSN